MGRNYNRANHFRSPNQIRIFTLVNHHFVIIIINWVVNGGENLNDLNGLELIDNVLMKLIWKQE